MMIKGLVDVLIPAYNCARYISRLLDSLLVQTYPDVNVIVIDDGSSDDTRDVIASYIAKFKKRNYEISYVYQENAGQSAAINNGLKMLEGEFLLWPDSDDWYKSNDAIEKFVRVLSSTDDSVGVARCQYEYIQETDLSLIRVRKPIQRDAAQDIFEDAIYQKNGFSFDPGGWMIKLKFLDRFLPNRNIFVNRHTGQNAQILLPYLAYSKCVTINEVLFCYLVRSMSHSRGSYCGYEREKIRELSHLENFISTIDGIKLLSIERKKDQYETVLKRFIYHRVLKIALKYKNDKETIYYYKKLKCLKYNFSKKERISFVLAHFLIVRKCLLNKFFMSFLALFAVVVCSILNSYAPQLAKKYYSLRFSPCQVSQENDFERILMNGVKNMLERKYISDHNLIYQSSFLSSITWKKTSVYEYGEYGILLHYAFVYAKEKNNRELMSLIRKKFDKGFCEKKYDKEKLLRNDQITYGNIAIDLYDEFGDSSYKSIAEELMNRLARIDSVSGIVLYRENSREQHVDAIGLVCPFLFYYAKRFDDQHAYNIAKKMILNYIRYGTDKETGLPVQTYDVDSHIKKNRANWGRGIAWFLLGLVNFEGLHDEDSVSVSKLEGILLKQNGLLYSQYFGDNNVDMSATIPILYYLYHKGLLNLSAEQYTKLISPFVDNQGVVRFCSPSIAKPLERPNAFQTSMAFQGLSLVLLSEILRDK